MSENEINMRSTKAEILDALNKAMLRAEAAEKGRLNPEKQEKEKIEKKVVESAVKSVGLEIFSKELIEKFNDLQAAIKVEEDRLKELYDVGEELQKLALAIEAGRERITEIQNEKEEKEEAARIKFVELTDEYDKKNAELKDEYSKRKTELQAEHDSLLKNLKQERTRENEEFQYNLTRTREKENNAWADEKVSRENELKKNEERAAELLADAERKIEYVKSLEEKVENIPGLIAAEKETAILSVTDSLKREFDHQNALAEMERKIAVTRLEDRVKYLTGELDATSKTVESLQGKLDRAYTEMRELASKTVESASGFKIIGAQEKT